MPAKLKAKEFEVIDHTADVGIMAYGTDLKQVFANAARGMFSIITDLKTVRASLQRDIIVEAADTESLLVAWLNELIYLCDTENFLVKKCEIRELNDKHLAAVVFGEKFDNARHQLKRGMKAATYHLLEIKHDGGYRARVVLDI